MDASVLVKLVAEEPGSRAARDVFIAEPLMLAPDLALIELFSALWKKARQGLYLRDQIGLAIAFIEDSLTEIVPNSILFARTSQLSLALEHPIYDCIYLALAERKEAQLVTADVALAGAAQRLGSVETPLITV